MDDLELSRLLVDARPGLARRGDPLSESARVTLERVMSDTERVTALRRGPRRGVALSIAAVVVVFLAVSIGVFLVPRPSPGYAVATPPLLTPTPVEGTAEELLMAASEHLVDRSSSMIRTQSWSLSMTIGESGSVEDVTVEPEARVVTHNAGGSRIEVRQAAPYDSLGNPIEVAGYEVGALVWEQDFGPGEFPYVHGVPPEDPAGYGAFLREPSGAESLTTGGYLRETQEVLRERSLSRPQLRALIQFLATLPGLEVEGKVTDRLGRSGISYIATDRAPGEYVDRIIVSDRGLGVLSAETTYVGHDRTDIQAPTVMDYIAWEWSDQE